MAFSGPLFFINVNDLAAVSDTIFPILFADDTYLFISNKSLTALIKEKNV